VSACGGAGAGAGRQTGTKPAPMKQEIIVIFLLICLSIILANQGITPVEGVLSLGRWVQKWRNITITP
jgi:hypothetical protein